MRHRLVGAGLIGLAAALSACADAYTALPFDLTLSRVDPEEAAERAIVGAALGAGLGAGLGTMASINPGIGTIAGAQIGAATGALIGVATTPPVPDYRPIAVPTALIPSFYDTWPPGYRPPPIASQIPPPRPG
jgi:hypothetical protein